jgi:hypothetical protein
MADWKLQLCTNSRQHKKALHQALLASKRLKFKFPNMVSMECIFFSDNHKVENPK